MLILIVSRKTAGRVPAHSEHPRELRRRREPGGQDRLEKFFERDVKIVSGGHSRLDGRPTVAALQTSVEQVVRELIDDNSRGDDLDETDRVATTDEVVEFNRRTVIMANSLVFAPELSQWAVGTTTRYKQWFAYPPPIGPLRRKRAVVQGWHWAPLVVAARDGRQKSPPTSAPPIARKWP